MSVHHVRLHHRPRSRGTIVLRIACLICLLAAASTARGQDYWQTDYLALRGGVAVNVLPAASGFYFEYLYPAPPNTIDPEYLPFSGSGVGAGLNIGAGVDLPIDRVKLLGEIALRYSTLGATESRTFPAANDPNPPTQLEYNYQLSLLSLVLDIALRAPLFSDNWYATGGVSSGYYLTNSFAGYQHITHQGKTTVAQMPSGKTRQLSDVEIQSQVSRYTFNPQQYAITVGVGRVIPLGQRIHLATELLGRIPLSSVFYGVTAESYQSNGVTPSKLWTLELNVRVEFPLSAPKKEELHPGDRTDQPSR